MPGHDLGKLEAELRSIQSGMDELLKIIHKPGYTSPIEFALVLGVSRGMAAQVKTLVTASKEIVEGAG